MATTKLYLDKRAVASGAPAPIKISLSAGGKSTLFSTGIKVLPDQWDEKTCKVVRHPQKQYLNAILSARKNEWDMALLKLAESGDAKKASSVGELKQMILFEIDPQAAAPRSTFIARFIKFMESRNTPGTRGVYRQTLSRMRAFDTKIDSRSFEDIDKRWLKRFEEFLSMTSKSANARSIHFRNIRAVFNEALADEITSSYPFRKFKIRSQPTAKRSLTTDQLRRLMLYPVEEYQEIYRDMFILMFYLCGINAVDLFNAPADAIINGRLEYVRAKTGKFYSIKVEPEAMDIIEKYKGDRYLLNIMDTRASYLDFVRRMDRGLKQIGPTERHGLGGKKTRTPLFPYLSQYWCRHTWATIAAELDIPKETIAAGLGHDLGNSTTAIYINFNLKKVDEANRRIIDYILESHTH